MNHLNERNSKGLCQGCGREKTSCICRRFRKNHRENMPEIFRNTRCKEIYEKNWAYEFRQQTLRITEEIIKFQDPNREVKEVLAILDAMWM